MKPIDLTLTISNSIPSFPGSPKPQFLSWSDLHEDGYNLELLFLSSHTGTHIDAPFHFVKNGIKIDQIPIDRLTGIGSLIKIPKSKNSAISSLTLILLRNNLEKSPTIPQFSFIQDGRKISKKKTIFLKIPD